MRLIRRHPTYLRIASEYGFVDALPGRLDEHARQQPGPYAKRLGKAHATHASTPPHTYTKREKQPPGVNEHVTLLQEHRRSSLSTIGFDTVMVRLPLVLRLPAHKTRQPANLFMLPLLCLPVACRRTTALGLSEPHTVDLTCLVWPTLPQVFPRPQHRRLCSSIASSGRRSCISAHATCLPYAFRPLCPRIQACSLSIPFVSGSPTRMNLLGHAH